MAQALPQNIIDQINEKTTRQYAEWKANATEEQKTSSLAKMQRFQTDEAFKNQYMERINKAFTDADADGDGRLNLAEYRVFDATIRALKTAEGEWHESDHAEENWNIGNQLSEGDGVSQEDLRAFSAPCAAKFNELKAADGL